MEWNTERFITAIFWVSFSYSIPTFIWQSIILSPASHNIYNISLFIVFLQLTNHINDSNVAVSLASI